MHKGVGEEEQAQRVVGERFHPSKAQTAIRLTVDDVESAEDDEEDGAVRDDERDVRVFHARVLRPSNL